MDYEEAYKEAIKRAKKLYEQGTITEILNYVFPELAESEDERIRKALLEMVNNFIVDGLWVNSYNAHKEDAIAWLEKQGETYTKKDVDDAWLKGICDAKRELEKQSAISPIHSNSSNIRKDEQKSALTGVEEQEGVAGRDYIPVEWVEAIESYGKWKIVRVNEQKPALSKENSCYYDDICEILINLINSTKSKINKDAIQKDLDWLISVKESQSRPAWSEEDEERLKSCLNILQAKGIMGVTETVNSKWLKSIKDRLKGE